MSVFRHVKSAIGGAAMLGFGAFCLGLGAACITAIAGAAALTQFCVAIGVMGGFGYAGGVCAFKMLDGHSSEIKKSSGFAGAAAAAACMVAMFSGGPEAQAKSQPQPNALVMQFDGAACKGAQLQQSSNGMTVTLPQGCHMKSPAR